MFSICFVQSHLVTVVLYRSFSTSSWLGMSKMHLCKRTLTKLLTHSCNSSVCRYETVRPYQVVFLLHVSGVLLLRHSHMPYIQESCVAAFHSLPQHSCYQQIWTKDQQESCTGYLVPVTHPHSITAEEAGGCAHLAKFVLQCRHACLGSQSDRP